MNVDENQWARKWEGAEFQEPKVLSMPGGRLNVLEVLEMKEGAIVSPLEERNVVPGVPERQQGLSGKIASCCTQCCSWLFSCCVSRSEIAPIAVTSFNWSAESPILEERNTIMMCLQGSTAYSDVWLNLMATKHGHLAIEENLTKRYNTSVLHFGDDYLELHKLGAHDIDKIDEKCHNIYAKYFVEGGSEEITIEGRLRNNFKSALDAKPISVDQLQAAAREVFEHVIITEAQTFLVSESCEKLSNQYKI